MKLDNFVHFDYLYLVVLKENSDKIEYQVCGTGSMPFTDLLVEKLPIAQVSRSQEPPHIILWGSEERSPVFKEWMRK